MRDLPPVFGRGDLGDLGLTPHHLTDLLRRGDVVQPVRGVYVPSGRADDPLVRATAVGRVLPPGAAIARETAAWVHGVDCRAPGRLAEPLPVHAVVATGREPPSRPGVHGHVDRLPPGDVTEVAGVPVTTPERTLLDVARFLPEFMGLAAADALAHRFGLDPQLLLPRLTHEWRRQRFVLRARRVLDLCEPRTESFGESWTRLRMVDAGFPRPEVQIWIETVDGVLVYRIDMGWRDKRVGIEYDGEEHHSSPADRAHDEARREELERDFDWLVVGVDRGDVLGRSLRLEHGVGELLGLEPQIRRRRW